MILPQNGGTWQNPTCGACDMESHFTFIFVGGHYEKWVSLHTQVVGVCTSEVGFLHAFHWGKMQVDFQGVPWKVDDEFRIGKATFWLPLEWTVTADLYESDNRVISYFLSMPAALGVEPSQNTPSWSSSVILLTFSCKKIHNPCIPYNIYLGKLSSISQRPFSGVR